MFYVGITLIATEFTLIEETAALPYIGPAKVIGAIVVAELPMLTLKSA